MPSSFFPIALAASFIAGAIPNALAQGARPSAAKENAEGDPSGAIQALGATGYNARQGKPPPAVAIPRLVKENPRLGGLPRGTR